MRAAAALPLFTCTLTAGPWRRKKLPSILSAALEAIARMGPEAAGAAPALLALAESRPGLGPRLHDEAAEELRDWNETR